MALTDNLLIYYKLDETGGALSVVDSVGTDNGTVSNAAVMVGTAGKINTCADMTGGNYYINSVNPGNSLDAFTICCWIKKNGLPGNDNTIIERSNAVGSFTRIQIFRIANITGKLHTLLRDGTNPNVDFFGTSNVTNNAWHFVALRNTGSRQSIWVDGAEESHNDGTLTGGALNTDFFIGKTYDAVPRYLQPWLCDEMAIYSRSLSDAELLSLWNSGNGTTYPFEATANISLNVGDAWKTATDSSIQVGGAWHDISSMSINVGDAWRTIF